MQLSQGYCLSLIQLEADKMFRNSPVLILEDIYCIAVLEAHYRHVTVAGLEISFQIIDKVVQLN